VPRDSAIERHHPAGCCRSGCRDQHCRKAGEQQRDQNPCCWFELNVSIFHVISFSCFGFVAVGLGTPETQTVFPFLPETLRRVAKKVWNRCCVSLVADSSSRKRNQLVIGPANAFRDRGLCRQSTLFALHDLGLRRNRSS